MKGSVYLTQKRLISTDDSESAIRGAVLVRATDGRTQNAKPAGTKDSKVSKTQAPKYKFSTIVDTADLDAFFVRYADICKAGMAGLKKRDRSAKKKGKAKSKSVKA